MSCLMCLSPVAPSEMRAKTGPKPAKPDPKLAQKQKYSTPGGYIRCGGGYIASIKYALGGDHIGRCHQLLGHGPWAWLRRCALHWGQCSIRCRRACRECVLPMGSAVFFVAGSVADLVRAFTASAISSGLPMMQCSWATGLVKIALSTAKVSQHLLENQPSTCTESSCCPGGFASRVCMGRAGCKGEGCRGPYRPGCFGLGGCRYQ